MCGTAFSIEDLTVLYNDPRMLLVRVQNKVLSCFVLNIHAPTQQDSVRLEWWHQLHMPLRKYVSGHPIIILGDFNARFGDTTTGIVGDLILDESYNAPPSLLRILRGFDLWLPSTYSACHAGSSWTWHPPGGGRPSRIDFIAIPHFAQVGLGGSYPLLEVDLGHKSLDHVAIGVDLSFWASTPSRAQRRNPGYRKAMVHPDNAHLLEEICDNMPAVDWNLDVHRHYEAIASHLRTQLQKAFPKTSRGRACSFISDSTWILRNKRVWIRKRVHLHRQSLATLDLAAAFSSWAGARNFTTVHLVSAVKLALQSRWVDQLVEDLRLTQKQLRQALRADKAAAVHEAAKVSFAGSARDVVQKLRPLLGPPRRHRRDRSPLPGVKLNVDGSMAKSSEEVLNRWIEHFALVEGGERMTSSQLAVLCVSRQFAEGQPHFDIDAAELPSLAQVEDAARNTAINKAMGFDGIPGEVAHGAPAALSRMLYPLFLKVWLRATEPLQFKGGIQHSVWKRKGPQDCCDSYRAILVSSVIGKMSHSLLRRVSVPSLIHSGRALQIGGSPRFPVCYGSHAVRLYQSMARSENYALIS